MKAPRVTPIGPECVRVASIRAHALSRGGSRLWVLSSLSARPRDGSLLRHGELPSELSVWSFPDESHQALRFEGALAIPSCAHPALSAASGSEAVLMSSLGAMRFSFAQGTGLRMLEHLSVEQARGGAAHHGWLRHAPFRLIDSVAGTCFNLSANGAYSVERSPVSSRLVVRRVADGACLAESSEGDTFGGAACIDNRGENVLSLSLGKVSRWNVREGTRTTLAASGEGLLAISAEDDLFAVSGERVALHRLSTGALLSATPYELLGSSSVSHDLSRCVTLSPVGLTTWLRDGDAWKREREITPCSDALLLGEKAVLVRNEKECAHVELLDARGALLRTLKLSAAVNEVLAVTRPPDAISSFLRFVTAKKDSANAPAALFALASGDLALLTNLEDPRFSVWSTGRKYAHTLAFSEPHGLIVAGHGLKDGLRGKRYTGNRDFETADGVSVWPLRGGAARCNVATSPASSWAIHGEGWLVGLRGTLVYRYDVKGELIARGEPVSFPLAFEDSAPSPRLLPNGESILTTVAGKLVVFDLGSRTVTPIAAAMGASVLAISGDSRRLLLAYTRGEGCELSLYALDAPETCLARWASRATGPAALSYDGSVALLTGGDTSAERVAF